MSKFKELAITFLNVSKLKGWSINIRGSVVSIEKSINPYDNNSFVLADMEYYDILSNVPVTKSSSSIWGTDGGGIGALSAMKSGLFTMNISGAKKTFTKELSKLI